MKLPCSTAKTNTITTQLIYLFEKYWDGVSPIRHVGVSCTRLSTRFGEQLNVFDSPKKNVIRVEDTIDEIRRRFGKTAIVRANSLKKGGTYIARSNLVGGHSGGNSLE